jgi:peptide/nickel transport system substrate-binding protein
MQRRIEVEAALEEGRWGDGMLTRRGFVGQGAALGAAAVLASCGGGSGASGSAKPKRGGTLRAGLTGGGSADTLNPFSPYNDLDYARAPNLFDYFVDWDQQSQPGLSLAEELTSNDDGTEWTIRLRDGVEFHNGKTATSEDMAFSLQAIVDPKSPGILAANLAAMDAQGIKRIDKRTIMVPFKRPFSVFKETLMAYGAPLVPVGFDPKKPVGSGPFKYESFTPGQQSTFLRHPNYWQQGRPYVDKLIITDYPDETSQVNALVSGEVDMVAKLTAGSISAVKNAGATVTIPNTGAWDPILFRVDVAPFNDPRVREALKLICDREQILESVYGGHGKIANDLYAPWDPVYNDQIPQRPHDPEKAKSLLKQAGQENLSATLTAANLTPTNVQVCEVYARQAQDAGVNIKINKVPTSTMFGPNYTKWPMATSFWPTEPYFPNVGQIDLPDSFYGETHFYKASPKYVSLYEEALRTLDSSRRTEIAHEMQTIYHQLNGYIISVFRADIDAHSSKVKGVKESNLGYSWWRYKFKNMWVA